MNTATVPDTTLEARLDAMADQVDELSVELRAQRAQRELLGELLAELAHVAGPAMQLLSERLGQLEAQGWFEFAGHSAGVVEKVVRAFDGGDIDALGDNVVTILETVRSMTQPDVMALVGRSTTELRSVVGDDAPPPSLPHLLGELREPEVKRGLERLLVVLRSMGEGAQTEPRPAGRHD